ncbi:MAG: 2-oxo acid dehydrogenase subunit E2 [Deltaproteobacteria bacterium]|nr:2-oxo acid dehydrogenase subunit E2 [Deltaproteobacteria bacterium]MBW2306757.1 2-oxo acid dehydrogenase subunit E2 [Deltaproteobacteria bacterium]
MPFEFKLPDLGEGLTEAEIVKWLVKERDLVTRDQPVVLVETDKAQVEIPSPRAGTVHQILAAEGEIVKVGQVLFLILEEGETAVVEQRRPSVGVVGQLEEAPEEEEKKVIPAPPVRRGKPLATPVARKMAKDLGVDLSRLMGTGPEGRITKEDVRRASETKPPVSEERAAPAAARNRDAFGPVERVPLRGLRRTTALAMAKSKSTAAHATAMDEADVTLLANIRKKEKQKLQEMGVHLTFTPFVIKAVVIALEEHPYLNASFNEEAGEIILKRYYNIGIATDTQDGLMVPVIHNAGAKSIIDLAGEIQRLSEKSRSRSVDVAELKGGTFSITNYGSIGGLFGVPIINHPEVAILGMGRIQEKPIVVDGKIEIRKILPLSLSFDHRVVDGAETARFLNTVIDHLENPNLILLDV